MKDAETKLTIAKKVLLDELQEQLHTERVEDVISWALEYYAENKAESTHGKAIAYCISQRILEEEQKADTLQLDIFTRTVSLNK